MGHGRHTAARDGRANQTDLPHAPRADPARAGRHQPRHDLQHSGLARAVVSDDTDLGVGKETEVCGLEYVSP